MQTLHYLYNIFFFILPVIQIEYGFKQLKLWWTLMFSASLFSVHAVFTQDYMRGNPRVVSCGNKTTKPDKPFCPEVWFHSVLDCMHYMNMLGKALVCTLPHLSEVPPVLSMKQFECLIGIGSGCVVFSQGSLLNTSCLYSALPE